MDIHLREEILDPRPGTASIFSIYRSLEMKLIVITKAENKANNTYCEEGLFVCQAPGYLFYLLLSVLYLGFFDITDGEWHTTRGVGFF